ncbi:hypothetical protein H4S14_001457 [Agrobacterium vitis]|nr:hypothetical protein [Agrobacterium vitis]
MPDGYTVMPIRDPTTRIMTKFFIGTVLDAILISVNAQKPANAANDANFTGICPMNDSIIAQNGIHLLLRLAALKSCRMAHSTDIN